MQDKATKLFEVSSQTGLKIHKGKTKLLKVNHRSQEPVRLENEPIKEVDSFTYLGSVVDKNLMEVQTRTSEHKLEKLEHHSYN